MEVSPIEPDIESDIKSQKKITELKTRSCIKAIGWRGIALGTTMSISYFYLGDITLATKIGVVDMGIKFIVHYIYERIWANIKWGYK